LVALGGASTGAADLPTRKPAPEEIVAPDLPSSWHYEITGYGWGTDFEFSFADSTVPTDAGDTLRLLGNLNSASGTLIKATQAQRDAYLGG